MIETQILLSIFDASSFFNWFIENANYWFVFIFMAIESSFIPFPSELVVPPAAYLATAAGSTSDMNVVLVGVVATAGALTGSLFNYFLSLWLGRPIVYAFADTRFAHACLIDREKVDRAEQYFDKHGAASTFFGRLIPVIRQLISIPAGLSRMNIGTFCIFTTLGAGIWNIVLCALGYWLGKTVPLPQLMGKIEEYNHYLTIIGVIIGVLCVAYIVWNAIKNKSKHQASNNHKN